MAAQRLLKFGFTATSAPSLRHHLLSRGSRLPVHISRVAPLASSIPQEPTQRSSYSVPEPCTKKQTFPKGVSSVAGQKMRAPACSKPSIEKPQLRQRSPKPASTASAKSPAAASTSEVFNRKAARDNRSRPWLVNSTLARTALPTRSKPSSSLTQAKKTTASDNSSMIRGRLSLRHGKKAKKTVGFADNLEQTIVVDRWVVRARHVNGARSPEGSRQFELEDHLLVAEEKYFSFQDSD